MVDIFGDTTPEPEEYFDVVLSESTGATIRDDRATVTIKSDDHVPDISISDGQADENGRYMYFTVSLSGATSKTVKVTYDTVDGTAVAPGDYGAHTGRVLSIYAGKTSRKIRVPVRNDSISEADETFEVVLSNPIAGVLAVDRAVGTIVDDD